MPPPEKPLPLPRPKPRPKPELEGEHELEPRAARPRPEITERDDVPGRVPLHPDPLGCAKNCSAAWECAYYPTCLPPPPAPPAATVHLRSSRLPTPLIALSASLLAVSAVLLVALLVHRLVRRRRRRRGLGLAAQQEAPLAHHGEEGPDVRGLMVAGEREVFDDGDGGLHHVWYIRTVGLDERAISAIAAVVYDAKKGGGGALAGDGDGSCAVCLAEFRDGETLRLLPRCSHAFHRGCIDTWLRAHVNCPLCRASVHVPASAASAAPGAATAAPRGEPDADGSAIGGAQAQVTSRGSMPERAVRRAASMVALPRRAWPDASLRAPASNSLREEEMAGLDKIRRMLKLSEALEMAAMGPVGRSVSFGAASCQSLPARSGPSAVGVSADEMPQRIG